MPRKIPVTLLFFITIFAIGCIQDKCTKTVCYNEGVCVESKCVCIGGYEGPACENTWDDKFEGEWMVDDTYIKDTTQTHTRYTLSAAGGTRDSFILYGLIDSVNGVVCKRSSLYGFTIQTQVIDCFITINSGKGALDTNNFNTVRGIYSFRHRNDKRDTIITINTLWTK